MASQILRWTLISTFYGCAPHNMDAYQNLVQSGMKEINYASQMDDLFKDTDHFVGSNISVKGTRKWNSEAFLYGRYVLTMQIGVFVSKDGRHVEKTDDDPTYRLIEVQKVTIKNGIFETDFSNQWTFGKEEWEKINKSQGDFSKAGIKIQKDHPVPNFDVYRSQIGRDRIKVPR